MLFRRSTEFRLVCFNKWPSGELLPGTAPLGFCFAKSRQDQILISFRDSLYFVLTYQQAQNIIIFMNSDILSCMKDADSLFFQQLGQRIATYRKDLGINQTELGEKLGVSQPVIASYEVGRRRVPVSALPILSALFGVSVDVLVGKAERSGKRGPSSKMQLLIDELDQLPRSQQQRILATMEDMLIAQQAKAS